MLLHKTILLSTWVILMCLAQHQFTEKHYLERRCDDRILIGFKECICHYKPTAHGYNTSNFAYQLILVNCTNTGFSSAESMQYLHQFSNNLYTYGYTELETFIFTGNTIEVMPSNFVGRSMMDKLAYLDLSNNRIQTINGKTFHSMPNLLELHLDNNEWFVDWNSPHAFSSIFNLEILSLNNAFAASTPGQVADNHVTHLSRVFEASSLDYLRELYLGNNNLYFVDESTFQHMESLEILSLAHNHLSDLNNVFNATCFPSPYVTNYMDSDNECHLQSLDLSYNDVETVPKVFLEQLDNAEDFRELNLKGNPLRCDCHLLDFYKWLKSSPDRDTVVQAEELICSQPSSLAGQRLTSLSEDDLYCVAIDKPKKDFSEHNTSREDFHYSSHAKLKGIIIGVLLALVAIGVILVLIITRKTALAQFGKVWQSAKGYGKFGKEAPDKEPIIVSVISVPKLA